MISGYDVKRSVARVLKRIRGAEVKEPEGIPDWTSILGPVADEWEALRDAAATGPRILLATSTGGWTPGVITDGTLAVALTLRGARVDLVLCDEFLPGCQMAEISQYRGEAEFAEDGPSKLCGWCYARGRRGFEPLGLPIHRYSDWVTPEEREGAQRAAQLAVASGDVGGYRWEGLAIGEHALAGALRFVARADFAGQPYRDAIIGRYVEGALLTAHALRRLIRTHDYEHVSAGHGIYVPGGIISDVARQEECRVSTWGLGYRDRTFIFSHDGAYHHTLMREPASYWEDMPWTESMEEELLGYLASRSNGSRDWISYHRESVEDLTEIEAEVGVDFSRPSVLLLTNILWDAQLFYEDTAFSGMLEWTLETIRYFARRPDLQLIIRVHPGEVKGGVVSRQRLVSEVRKAIPELPENVFIIPPESEVSTYRVASQCDSAIVYATKTGLELASVGLPIIVAGEAWIRNKGISFDAHSEDEYFELLDGLPFGKPLSAERTLRARKYAYHFFFRRMIPLDSMESRDGYPPLRLKVEALEELRPGHDPGLDVICDGILGGSEFMYPAEREHAAPGEASLAADRC